jgi:hypothetical protein
MSAKVYDVFTVVEGSPKSQKKEYWIKVGAMFPHKNGDGGFNLVFNALPLDKKLVIKPKRKDRTQEEKDNHAIFSDEFEDELDDAFEKEDNTPYDADDEDIPF